MKFCKRSLKEVIDVMLEHMLTISEDRVWKIISQFFIALAILKDKNMVHGNVNDESIFLDENDNVVVSVYWLGKEMSYDSDKVFVGYSLY
jgi:serine/threonine protein kinase